MNPTVSVVIPTYNTWNLTSQLVADLVRYEQENINEIILVDDGSKTPMDRVEGFPVHRLPQNIGFTLACNYGLSLALKPPAARHAIFLISNDVRVKGKFIEQASDILFGARRAFVGNKMFFGDTGWNTFNGVTFPYLEGAFLACTSDGWRDLGLFDESYAPFDYEDVDISTYAKYKGYKLEALNNPNIIHQGGGTLGYTTERRTITERNREYFKKKWIK